MGRLEHIHARSGDRIRNWCAEPDGQKLVVRRDLLMSVKERASSFRRKTFEISIPRFIAVVLFLVVPAFAGAQSK